MLQKGFSCHVDEEHKGQNGCATLVQSLYDTKPFFVYIDQLLCHCIFIDSDVHWQLVYLVCDRFLYSFCLLVKSCETINHYTLWMEKSVMHNLKCYSQWSEWSFFSCTINQTHTKMRNLWKELKWWTWLIFLLKDKEVWIKNNRPVKSNLSPKHQTSENPLNIRSDVETWEVATLVTCGKSSTILKTFADLLQHYCYTRKTNPLASFTTCPCGQRSGQKRTASLHQNLALEQCDSHTGK